MAPAQQVLRVWQGLIGNIKGLTSIMDIQDEALRSTKLQRTLSALDSSVWDTAEFPRLHRACCERLVLKMKVGLCSLHCSASVWIHTSCICSAPSMPNKHMFSPGPSSRVCCDPALCSLVADPGLANPLG